MSPKTSQNKFFYVIFSLMILVSLSMGLVGEAHAQQEAPDQVIFSQVYSGVRTLRGPLDVTSIGFRLPTHWSTPTGGQLELSFNMLLFASGKTDIVNSSFKAIVQVSLNNIDLGSAIVEKEGVQSTSFPIPAKAWAAVNLDGINDITIRLTTNDECGGTSLMTIDGSSVLSIPHGTKPPSTDLTALPQPFYQDSFYPDVATLVLPDNPTPGAMRAALAVAAGMGRFTNGKLQLTTVTASDLSDTALKNSNLVFVGQANSFPQLNSITWPGKSAEVKPDDGLLQMAVSPWNPFNVVLWVSGTSDAGIIKAGEVFGSGQIRTGVKSNIAIIAETHSNETPVRTVIDSTLSGLGYSEEYRQGEGTHSIDYIFTLPYSQSANDNGYINLKFANSALLDFTRSGFSVSVNDQFIGSGRFTERSTNIDTVTITIPQSAIVPGQNKITVLETLKFPDVCARPVDGDLWATVRPESTLHIPIGPAAVRQTILNLRAYSEAFSPTLNTMAFILAPSDPLGWSIAANVAYDLGRKTQGALISPDVAFANDIPSQLRQERSLLLIGRPSSLPILSEMDKNMPAAFLEGSDIAVEPQSELTFRLPVDTPSGYLEMFPSPWNQERLVFALLGNNKQGLLSAQNALLTPELRNKLSGNLAVIYGNNIYASDAPFSAASQSVTVIVPPTPSPTPTNTASTGLSQSSLVLTGIVAVVIFVFAAIFILMQRRRTLPK